MVRRNAGSQVQGFIAISVLLASGLVLALATFALPEAQAQSSQVTLRAGVSHPKGGLIAGAVDNFIEIVKKKSNGQIEIINLYQALGVEQQLAQAVMSGSVDIGMCGAGNSSRFTDALMTFDLPFLFKKYENLFNVLDGPIGDKVKAKYEKDLGVKYLFNFSQGSGRDIFTRNKQLRVPADIKGLKIRTVSTPVDLLTFEAWGANPTPVDWSQCYSALQQGVVDGFQPELGAILVGKYYEVVKYTLRIDYQALFGNVFMNGKKFASLSPAHQKILMESTKEAHAMNLKEAANYISGVEKELTEKHGHIIYKPTPAEYAQWASIREGVWKKVEEKMKGKVDVALANEIYAAQK